jgi:hypothetical protein
MVEQKPNQKRLMKVNALGKLAGVSGGFVKQLIAEGKLAGYALSERILLASPDELFEVIERGRVAPASPK